MKRLESKGMLVLVIGVYVVLSVSGVVLVKLGATNPLSLRLGDSRLQLSFGYITLVGFLCYICSFLIYMTLIAKLDLSFIVPLAIGCIHLLTLISSVTVFKERLTVTSIIGCAMILAGVVLVGLRK